MISFALLMDLIVAVQEIETHNRTRSNNNTNMFYNTMVREDIIKLFGTDRNKECGLKISPTFPKDPVGECITYPADNSIQAHAACYDLWTYIPKPKQYINKVLSVGGVFGHYSLMSKADYIMLDFVFRGHRNLKNVVEFGTALGTTTLYLGMVSRMRGGQTTTYDYFKTDCRTTEVKRGWLDNMHFKQADLLSTREVCVQRENLELAGHCTPCDMNIAKDVYKAELLLVDNGEKIREASLFAKYLPVGGVVMVHDHCGPYGEPYESILPRHGFIAKYGDFSSIVESCLRVWERVKEGEGRPNPFTAQPTDKCYPIGYRD